MVNDIEFYDVDNSCVKTAIAPFRIDLDVPYGEKETAKSVGMQWDSGNKTWFVPSGMQFSQCSQWIQDKTIFSRQYYVVRSMQTCWSCKNAIPVYSICFVFGLRYSSESHCAEILSWPHYLAYTTKVSDFALKKIQEDGGRYEKRYSKLSEMEYYMNHCHCGASQGDFFLYQESEGAFLAMHGDDYTELVATGYGLHAEGLCIPIEPWQAEKGFLGDI